MKEILHELQYASELIKLAEADLDSAEKLFQTKARIENSCFFAQQCVEKALKAVLVNKRISFPHVHDLGVFLGKLSDENLPPDGYDLLNLNVYSAQRRYEEGPYPATEDDVKNALRMAKSTLHWAKKNNT